MPLKLLDQAINALKEQYPEKYMWAMEKRVDFSHPNYLAHKYFQLSICTVLMGPDLCTLDYGWSISSILMKEKDFPFYYINRDFAQAVLQTEPPADLALSDLHFPFPAFAVALPLDFSLQLFSCRVPFLVLGLIEGGIEAEVPKIFRPSKGVSAYVNSGTKMFCGGLTYDTKDEFPLHYGGLIDPHLDFKGFLDWTPKEYQNPLEGRECFKNTVLTPEQETNLPKAIAHFSLKLLSILNSGVPIAQRGPMTKAVGVPNTTTYHTYHPPLWIAPEYRIRTEESERSHKSPRMHWRRGHVRRQHYGKGNLLVKSIWIEPYLVNKPNE